MAAGCALYDQSLVLSVSYHHVSLRSVRSLNPYVIAALNELSSLVTTGKLPPPAPVMRVREWPEPKL